MSKMQTIRNRRWNRDKLWLSAAFALVFGGIGTALLLASHAATPLQPSVAWSSQNGELVNIKANLCLGTPGTAQAPNGTGYIIETCNGASDQKWSLAWGSGTVTSTTVKNGYGQCLDDTGNSTHAGNPTQAWPCSGVVQQTWTTGYGDGTIRIHGLCLGVNGNAKTSGSTVVIMACNVPTPAVTITAPASGTALQGTTTVTATASISGDNIASITLTANGTTLKTCANAGSCSASWNTAQVGNGTYTITATAIGALGGSATASRSVAVNNPAPSPPPSTPPPSGGGGSSGGGSPSGGSSGTGGSGTSGGGSGSSSAGTITGSPSSGDTSGNTDTLDNSNTSDSIDTSSSAGTSDSTIDTSGGTGTSGTTSDNQQSSSSATNSPATRKSSGSAAAAAIVSGVVLLAAVVFFVIWRRQQLAGQTSAWSYDTYGVPPAPTGAPYQTKAEPEHIDPNYPAFPREDPAQTAARVNWWLPDDERAKIAAGQTPAHSASPPPPADDNPPDIFEEGRKRLEQEESDGHIKH